MARGFTAQHVEARHVGRFSLVRTSHRSFLTYRDEVNHAARQTLSLLCAPAIRRR